jgi:enoyl-CoA hydratase/carnithine racemase
MTSASSDLEIHADGDVTTLVLARPSVRNALRAETYDELEDVLLHLSTRALIITGADPAFCSGDDVRQVMGGGGGRPAAALAREPRLTPAAGALLATDVPVIAAVNGAAVGWGMELALLADFRIASDRARFGELFIKRGLVSDVAGLGRLAQLVGREKATEILLLGRIIDAPEALRIGLVGRVVEHHELMAAAMTLAGELAAQPPLAVAAIKEGLRRALDPDWSDLGRWVTASLRGLFATEDHKEGAAAFLEKREPTFVGR